MNGGAANAEIRRMQQLEGAPVTDDAVSSVDESFCQLTNEEP